MIDGTSRSGKRVVHSRKERGVRKAFSRVGRGSLFALAAWTSVGYAMAQGVAPTIPASSPRIRFETPDPRWVDSYIPVVTMEQLRAAHTSLQGYRVEVYADGAVVYHGLRDVRTLGEVRDYVSPDAVQVLLKAFHEYKFWEVPEYQFGSPAVHAWPTLIFTAREEGKSRAVYFSGQNQGLMLRKLVEDLVHSDRWRCPYVTPENREVCELRESYAQTAVANFLKYDLPALQEKLK